MVSQCTKYEVSRFTRYEAMNGGAKCRKWGGQGALKVNGNVTIRQSAYDFLFDFNRNHASILQRFRDIASYLSKVADFDPPHLHSAPSQGVTPVEFRGDFWHQKTRVFGVSCGVVRVILRLATLVELRLVTDGQTERHGHRHRPMASTAVKMNENRHLVSLGAYQCFGLWRSLLYRQNYRSIVIVFVCHVRNEQNHYSRVHNGCVMDNFNKMLLKMSDKS